MNLITQISRVLTGLLFIFSGLIKLNDPLGFSYKLDEYFAPDVLNLPFLQAWVLEMSVFIVILEVLLGVALLIGFWKNITSWLLLLMIVFFTFLTFYSAYFDKVTDCGCFGDAIPLTPWESFGKDLVLLVLILIVFFNRDYIRPVLSKGWGYLLMGLTLAGCLAMGIYVLNHLPLKDFRPYAPGKSIREGMKSAEELGLTPTKYGTIYTMQNTLTGERKKVNSEDYVSEKWYEKKDWKILPGETESVVLEKGYEPPIHDFFLYVEDEDMTETLLNLDAAFLVIAYDITKTAPEAYQKVNAFAEKAQKAGIAFYGISASLPGLVEQKRHELQAPFPFGTMDETTLKTIIRANPGIVLLKEGRIVAKWHYRDLPSFEQVQQNHL